MGTWALAVTPRLHVGDATVIPSEPVQGAQEALNVIKHGKVALLPSGAWKAVAEALEGLGLNPDEVADRIHFARTGEVGTVGTCSTHPPTHASTS